MNLQTKSTNDFKAQNYTSVTAHQQVLGRSVIKGYMHNRQATGNAIESENNTFNRIAGLEFLYLSRDNRLRSFAGYGKSWSTGLSGDDHFYNAAIGYNSRVFSFYTNISGVGNNYRSDVGFIPRFNHYDAARDTTLKIGFTHGYTDIGYKLRTKEQKNISSHNFSVFNVLDYTQDGFDLIQNLTTLEYEIAWVDTRSLSVQFTHEEQGLLFPFRFTDTPIPAGTYKFNHFSANYASDERQTFSYRLGYRNGDFYNGKRQEYSFSLKYRIQPWGNFSANVVYNNLEFPSEFGSTDLLLIGPKIEFNFSKNLYWTTFLQFNTQSENFNVNSRVQWRFKPLSDLFIVYTDNYATDNWGPKNRGVVIKINYWYNL